MLKLSATILTSFLYSFLISAPSGCVSAADRLLRKTDAERFSTYFETTLKLLGCFLGMTKVSDIFEKASGVKIRPTLKKS